MIVRIRATGQLMTDDDFRQHIRSTKGGSFGTISSELLDEHGADVVLEGPQASGGTVYQYSMRDGVEEIKGQWYTRYILGPVFTDERDEAADKSRIDSEQAARVRAERNTLLASCDWTQLTDAQVDKAMWAAYRQGLRDISAAKGFPWTMQWPKIPTG